MQLVINFSGGKDSTAMLAWLCEQYPDVPKHDPEAINIIDNIEKKIGFTMFNKGPIKNLISK